MANLKFNSTAEIKIPKRLIEQVIGQDEAVEVIKKAAQQRRHVLLIGEPGTGKSMLGIALAELLPMEKLVDIISFPNPNDENMPLIRTVPAGQGRDLVAKAKLQSMTMFKNQNIIMFILVLIAMFAPWWARSYYKSDIMFAAFFLGGTVFLIAFAIFLNLGKRVETKVKIPRVIVDNYKRKQASFNDATGAHAGALLGDVLHDPFQCFYPSQVVTKFKGLSTRNVEISSELDKLFLKNKDRIRIIKNKNDYEAIFLEKNGLSVLGETNGSVSPVEVLSCNRHDYDAEMIKLTTSENKELIVTPEHKIAIWNNGKVAYVEAKDIKENDEIVSKAEDIIIDEQDIINTYSQEQRQLSKSYYQYLKDKGVLPLKIDNPKLPLIAKVLGATFGDGGIFENLNGIFLSSSEKEPVEEFGRDIENIFELESNENSRIIEGGVYGHSWCYQNTNRNIIRFFLALGAPHGNKSSVELIVPKWITFNNIFEDEFYGSVFGGEIGISSSTLCGARIEFGITGSNKLNRYHFLNQIVNYLNKKGIEITGKIYSYKRRNKEDSNIFRFVLSQRFENSQKFVNNIKINYCKYKKEKLVNAINEFRALKKNKYEELISRGYGAENVMKILQLTPKSLYMVLNEELIA